MITATVVLFFAGILMMAEQYFPLMALAFITSIIDLILFFKYKYSTSGKVLLIALNAVVLMISCIWLMVSAY